MIAEYYKNLWIWGETEPIELKRKFRFTVIKV